MAQTTTYHDLDHGITVVDAEYGTSGVAAIYLMIEGNHVAVIETGINHSVPLIEQVLSEKGLSFDSVRYVIPTHVHLDHAGGAGELMRQCSNAQLIIHPFGAAHMINPSRLEAGTVAVYGEDKFHTLYESIIPIDASRVIQAPDGFTVSVNGRLLEFLDTPGHARHHFCVVDKSSEGIFTGDTFGISYPQLTTSQGPYCFASTTPVQFDPEALLASIDRLMSYQAKYMYVTHFGALNPTARIVKQLKHSVNAFKTIGLDTKSITENRIDILQNKIREYLLTQLAELACEQSVEFQSSVIENDTLLNAQGIDVWLSRMAKKGLL